MTRLLLPLLFALLVRGMPAAADDNLPLAPAVIDDLSDTFERSGDGLDLTLENAGFYAGWIPRGFVAALLRQRPELLPGEPLSEAQWLQSTDYREGLHYMRGLTTWAARHRAERFDRKLALDEANRDYLGTPIIQLGRFIGFASDMLILVLILLALVGIKRAFTRQGLRRQEQAFFAQPSYGHRPKLRQLPAATYTHPYIEDLIDEPQTAAAPPPGPMLDPVPNLAPDPTADAATTAPPVYPTGTASDTSITTPIYAAPPTTAAPAPIPADSAAPPREAAFSAYQACRVAAEDGSAEHQFQLAGMFRHGRGVTANREEATYWFRRAAESGHAQAQYELARRLFHGVGALPDEHAAALWLEQAAQQGLTDARFNLATLYARGHGVTHDPDTARHWLEEAANDGDSDAGDLLQTVYEQGWLGVAPDLERARYWHQQALADRL